MRIVPLSDWHDRKQFDCGNEELNGWFARIAKQHMEKRISSTFVAAEDPTSPLVLGFYSVTLAELDNSDLPAQARKRMPLKVPAFWLGRLATAKSQQGKGIGEFLLFDAINRTKTIAKDVGGAGLVVDAKRSATGFYLRFGFEQLVDHPLKLFLPF